MGMKPGIVFDDGLHKRAKLGFILLANDETIEEWLQKTRPQGVGVHCTRCAMPLEITAGTLAGMKAGLAASAALVAPDVGIDVICFACTSGSCVIGIDNVCAELTK